MNINFNLRSDLILSFFNENLVRPFTDRQKKIVVIAAIAFGFLAACYVLHHYFFRAKPQLVERKPLEVPTERNEVEKKDESPLPTPEEKPVVLNAEEKKSGSPLLVPDEKPVVLNDDEKKSESSLPIPQEKPVVLNDEEKKSESSLPTLEVEAADEVEQEQQISLETQELLTFDPSLNLLLFGKVRQGSGKGDLPNFTGMQSFKEDTIIDTEKLWTAAFACCFHTTESQEEIFKLIKDTRIKADRFASFYEMKYYCESYERLYNNLVQLHDALPGPSKAKEIKIYWNNELEKTLLPYFLMNENVAIDQLLFALVPGEEITSPFQAPKMDFTYQLQFVGLEKDKILSKLKEEIQKLSQAVLGEDVFAEVEKLSVGGKWKDHPLIAQAYAFTLQNNIRNHLLTLYNAKEKIKFAEMSPTTKNKYLINLSTPHPWAHS